MINIANPIYLPLGIYDLIFGGAEISYRGEPVERKLVTVKKGGTVKKAIVGDFLYLEQNPLKDSEHGRLAKDGHKIMWIIYKPRNKEINHPFKPGTYIAKVMDGVTHRLV